MNEYSFISVAANQTCDLAPCSLKAGSSVMSKHPQSSVGAQTSDSRNGVLFFSGVLGKRAEPCLLGASVQGAAEVRAV